MQNSSVRIMMVTGHLPKLEDKSTQKPHRPRRPQQPSSGSQISRRSIPTLVSSFPPLPAARVVLTYGSHMRIWSTDHFSTMQTMLRKRQGRRRADPRRRRRNSAAPRDYLRTSAPSATNFTPTTRSESISPPRTSR